MLMRILCAAERDIFGIRARGTHSNEREGALRIDSDAVGTVELGGAAVPSFKPWMPVPASVVTVSVSRSTFRMR